MADVIPFKAIRPVRDKAHLVASRSYISYHAKALRSKLDENPFTFLHILNPEYNLKKGERSKGAVKYEKVRQKFDDFVDQQILEQDDKACYYLYRQIKDGHPYLGIIGCAAVEDYNQKVIKKHEATIAKREEMFKEYLKGVEINAEPVCFTYPNQPAIDQVVQQIVLDRAEYDFTTTNKVRHTFWIIDQDEHIATIQDSFARIDSIYIADGHHRSASSALLGNELKAKNPQHKGDEKYNHFMGIFIPESELQIYEFNRLVKDIGKLTTKKFLKALNQEFEVLFTDQAVFNPRKVHEIGMYLEGKWYCLIPKEGLYKESDPVNSLDVAILTNHLLDPILGIKDLRTDKRIAFLGGLAGVEALMKEVDSGRYKVAFSHFPVSMQQLKDIANADQIMPPKSTWIEPKLRSGLTVYSTSNKDD
ncbi:MAG: DUF1015 domain-containing protein [Vicingaceae bacterium]